MIVIDKASFDFSSNEIACSDSVKYYQNHFLSISCHALSLGVKNLSLVNLPSNEQKKFDDNKSVVKFLTKTIDDFNDNNIKLKFTAERQLFSDKLNRDIAACELLTSKNSDMTLNIVLHYSFKQELIDAVKNIMHKCKTDNIAIEGINESTLASELDHYELGDIELFIRTGGESMLGAYLVWQLAYSELYFFNKDWQYFSCHEFDLAIDWFCNRERRFGKTSEQLN